MIRVDNVTALVNGHLSPVPSDALEPTLVRDALMLLPGPRLEGRCYHDGTRTLAVLSSPAEGES